MIYTFYSFKGGVGRSMGMANIAEILYQRGLKVLMVDFDLEAPGLERFFDRAPTNILAQRGVIDMLLSYKALRSLPAPASPSNGGSASKSAGLELQSPFPVEPLVGFIVPIYPENEEGGALYLIPSGCRDGEEYTRYAERIRTFDWEDFYRSWDGEKFFDWFRQEAETIADVVLIDSRTGLTEMSGVCTFHLADVVVMFVAPNQQNLDGTQIMANSLANRELIEKGRKGRELWQVFVPSRVEVNESDLQDLFAARFEESLSHFYPPQLKFENKAFIDLKIPYVPYYSYMEKVAVRDRERTVASDMLAGYQRLTAAMLELAPRSSSLYRNYFKSTVKTSTLSEALQPILQFVGRDWVFAQLSSWLASSDRRAFLITGGPGCGKTTLARRLAEISMGIVNAPGFPQLFPGFITYTHFRNLSEASSLDPLRFVEALCRALASRFPEFASALTQAVDQREVTIEIRQSISGTARGASQVTGIKIENLVIGHLSPFEAFDRLITRPLQRLAEVQFEESIVILVDGLDEALTFTSDENFLRLLPLFEKLPVKVNLIATSRPDSRILRAFDAVRLDLIQDAPTDADDILSYIYERLKDLDEDRRTDLALQVSRSAQGNFLFAHYMVEEILLDLTRAEATAAQALPLSLYEVYRQFLKRTAIGNKERWEKYDRPFLGILAVAQSPGLTIKQMAGITNLSVSEVNDLVRTWGPYLISKDESTDSPYVFFHNSFRDFLLSNEEYRIFPAEAHEAIGRCFHEEYEGRWLTARDDYAIQYTTTHLLAVLRLPTRRKTQTELTNILTALFRDESYIRVRIERFSKTGLLEELHNFLETIPLDKNVSNELKHQLEELELGTTQSSEVRFIKAEIQDHHPSEPLRLGEVYTLTFGVDAAASQTLMDLNYYGSDEESVWVDIQLFSQDFEIYTGPQQLLVARTGRSRNKARFDIEPKHEGPVVLHAVVSRNGNFIQVLSFDLTSGTSDSGPVFSVRSMGSAVDRAFSGGARDLTLAILNSNSGYHMVILTGATVAMATLNISSYELRRIAEEARSALFEIIDIHLGKDKPYVDDIEIPSKVAEKALHFLAKAGHRLYQQIFFGPQADTQVNGLGEMLRELSISRQLKIKIITQDFNIPWGMLYMVDELNPEEIKADYFLGLQHIVENTLLLTDMPIHNSLIKPRKGLQVALMLNNDIDSQMNYPMVKEQTNYWKDLEREGIVNLTILTSRNEILSALADPNLPYQIICFMCDSGSDKSNENPDKTALVFTDNQEISLRDMKDLSPVDQRFINAPLVFMNVTTPADPFILYFMARGVRGVIGGEIELPARFGVEWSKRFFERFLHGNTLGETILDLRREFFHKHNNILGFLFTMYADADTQVVLPES